MKRLLLTFILCFSISLVIGQNTERIFKDASLQKGAILKVRVNDGEYRIQFYNPQIVETSFLPHGEIYTSNSHAVVLKPKSIELKLQEDNNMVSFLSKGIKVQIQKTPFKISYFYKGEEVVSEKKGYYKSKHQPMDLVKGNIIANETEKIEFNLSSNEVLYGGGSRALPMNRRGYRLPLFNRAHYGYETHSELMNYTIPLVVSSKKYMIHFDNAPVGYLDLDSKKNNALTYETISGRKTYQVVLGNSWEGLIHQYTNLTGKQPMLPRWALGNFSSRFGYHSQQETENTIAKFKDENIPVDAVILDLYWFGKEIKGTMGNLEVYKDSFPDMPKMIRDFKKQGVKTVLITEPFILKDTKKWKEVVEKDVLAKDTLGNPARYDFYFGNTGLIDIYNPKGEQWFWNIYRELIDIGVAGMWGDLGEPEVHPTWVQHATGSANEVHNIYGHDWARLVYEGYEKEYPNQRPFILMRAGYSGSQRYGMIPWSGDVNRTWGGLQSQPSIALQMGMQGLGYMHSDLGGFAGANLDDELYVRWLQYGVFQPIFRPHAQEEVASEPVFRSEKAKNLARKAIELRYKLLPYNYNLVFKNHIKGIPLMRPLFFEDDDLNLISSSYLWGKDILVTPVLEKAQKQQKVVFPKNANWVDFYSGKVYKGATAKEVVLKENSIPTFVRSGAFIPMTTPMQTTKEYNSNQWEVHYYYDTSVEESKRTFYNDDGVTPKAFEKEQYEQIIFKATTNKDCLDIALKAEVGKQYSINQKEIQFVVHNMIQQPKRIKYQGKEVDFTWEALKKQLSLKVKWNTKRKQKISIKL